MSVEDYYFFRFQNGDDALQLSEIIEFIVEKVDHHIGTVPEHFYTLFILFEYQAETHLLCRLVLPSILEPPRDGVSCLHSGARYTTSDMFCPSQLNVRKSELRPTARFQHFFHGHSRRIANYPLNILPSLEETPQATVRSQAEGCAYVPLAPPL